MMLLRQSKAQHFIRTTIMVVVMLIQNISSQPQDTDMFENVASRAIAVIGNMAEMIGDAGMIIKQINFDMPFAKANSETQLGTGATLTNSNDDDDSSEEDRRRKRSIDLLATGDSAAGEELWFALPLSHPHVHRGKRSPCHKGGGTAGGGGTGTDDDINEVERRRRARARKRKAASEKKATNSRKKKLINDDNEKQVSRRRKRQSEVDDLNQNMESTGNNFSQHVQQIAEKLRNVWENFMNSLNNMARKVKQHFTNQNSTNTVEI